MSGEAGGTAWGNTTPQQSEWRQEAYERIRAWFTRPDAVFGWGRLNRTFVNDLDDAAPEKDGLFQACVYRGNGDPASPIRCSVGVLIPDDKYDPSFEDQNVFGEAIQKALGLDDKANLEWLAEIQNAHDFNARRAAESSVRSDGSRITLTECLADFVKRLDGIAKRSGLEVVA